jgi:transcription-repair coupling factor (superfamily II helicase)
LGVDAYLTSTYVPDETDRMMFYRRLSGAGTAEEVDVVAADLEDRAGPPPPEAQALLDAVRLRIVARSAGVTSITWQDGRFAVRFGEGGRLDEAMQRRLRAALGGRAQVSAVGLTVRASGSSFTDRASALRETLTQVGRLSAHATPVPTG